MSETHPLGNPNALVGSPDAAQARAIFEQQRLESQPVPAHTVTDDDDDDFEEFVDVNTLHNEDAE